MKKILFLLFAIMAVNVTAVRAQKIGRVLFQEIVMVLPEMDSVSAQVQRHGQQLEADMEQMRVEYNNKLESYQKNKATYSAAIDEQKQRELNEYGARYQEFSQTAQTEFQNVQYSLTQPIFIKVGEKIQEVAKEQGLTMVVDLSQGNNILYVDEANTTDITPLVKSALGVDPNAKPKTAQQQVVQ
ncbi:MAG: OmpH family outer membrane protein [Rikenellaceae bacterium]